MGSWSAISVFSGAPAAEQPVSPTDFAMSVHNSAVGNLTIAARQPVVSSSVSAGMDTFQQSLCDVLSLLHAGYSRVLLVDFDGLLPDFLSRRAAAADARLALRAGAGD